MKVPVAVLVAFVVSTSAALAARTPEQLGRALVAENPNVLGLADKRATVERARCRKEGTSGFLCITTYAAGKGVTQVVWLWVKPRRAGGLCVSPSGLRWVPTGCLASGSRARGGIGDADSAVRRTLQVSPIRSECIGHGSGFYSCQWTDRTGTYRASVTFAPMPVVRLLRPSQSP